MKIELNEISVRELSDGYEDNAEGGVVGYGGKLDIRPPFQREFVYKDKQRDAVINTVRRDFPLNVMYWAVREDGGFEVIDGLNEMEADYATPWHEGGETHADNCQMLCKDDNRRKSDR